MTEITLNDVSKNFGFKNVLDSFNLEVLTGEKIGLIGPNGCGKSTIFNLIVKNEIPEHGMVSIRNGSKVALLSQMPPKVDDSCTVKDILTENFRPVFEIEEMMRKLENEMAKCNEKKMEKIFKRYGTFQDKFANLDGYMIDSKINEICNNFKLDNILLGRKFNSLSGGEKTIIQFASIMLAEPTILLLDEPTNNLDIDRLEQLENYLKNYNGTIVMSSHDRYFLDRVSTKIVLIERGKSEIFFGNYSYYLKENERRILAEFENYKDQQKMIEAMKRKIKQLQEFGKLAYPQGESFFKRAASIQKRLNKIDLLDKPEQLKEIPLNFQMVSRSGKQVLIFNDFDLSIGEKELLKSVTFNVEFKDVICLMGKNGSGKSTLVKYIMNLYTSKNDNKNIKIGSNVSIGYVPQIILFEDDKRTVLDEARKCYNGTESHLRAMLAKFMFNSDDVFKRVESLSGGEKVRLKLFELIQNNINLLIMDEPTNHIDINTKEILETALKEFKGTIIFISHDRYFINELAKKILYIQDEKIYEYIGNYDDYLEKKIRQLKSKTV